MEPNENQAVAAFDTLYTNNHIQILKVLLPYFDVNSRKKLAILIKFMELRYTMDYFSRHAALISASKEEETGRQPDIVKIFEQIKKFCTPSERAMFDQLANMKKSMEMYEEMMNMMQLFSQFMPEGSFDASAFPQAADSGKESGRENHNEPGADSGSGTAEASSMSGGGQDDYSGQNFNPFGNANPMDMLKGMLSEEQQAMFDMFQASFGNTNH